MKNQDDRHNDQPTSELDETDDVKMPEYIQNNQDVTLGAGQID